MQIRNRLSVRGAQVAGLCSRQLLKKDSERHGLATSVIREDLNAAGENTTSCLVFRNMHYQSDVSRVLIMESNAPSTDHFVKGGGK